MNLDGEAFFKVAKGEVFDVITKEGTVTVVGTQFNVKQRSNYFEVECYEGIVKVIANNTTKELLAGDTFRLYENDVTFNTTSYQLPQWAKDVSDFKSVPFSEVISELERQYNISVTYNTENATRLFSLFTTREAAVRFKLRTPPEAIPVIETPIRASFSVFRFQIGRK